MRQLIVVDVETTALRRDAAILEIAAINTATGEEFYLVPYVEPAYLAEADREALAINRYYERRLWEHATSSEEENISVYSKLKAVLSGNTLGGCNPAFDADFLKKKTGRVWHHRLADLSAYTAGALGLSLTELPGLHKVCELLGVTNEEEHSAMGDARATAECFRLLQSMIVGKI